MYYEVDVDRSAIKECTWSGKLRKFLLYERKVYRAEQKMVTVQAACLKETCSPEERVRRVL